MTDPSRPGRLGGHKALITGTTGALFALAAGHASANVGIPVLAMSLELSVIFLIPVIALETLVVHRTMPLPLWRSFGVMTAANLLSTFAGVLLVLASVFVPLTTPRGWFADAFTLVSLFPLFYMSRWIESRYAVWRVKYRSGSDVRQAVHRANLASYVFLALFVIARIAGHVADAPCMSVLLQGCYGNVADALSDMRIDEAKKLARSGGDLGEVRRDPSGGSLLHKAVRVGDAELLRLLTERGLDVRFRDLNGNTPLMVVAIVLAGRSSGPAQEMMKVLFAHGARVDDRNNTGRTALHLIARTGDAGSVALLLERGADPNAVDEGGETPLDLATRAELTDTSGSPFAETVKLLIAHGGRKSADLAR